MTTALDSLPMHLVSRHPSTNDLAAKQALDPSTSSGTCWVADVQTSGRGRRDTEGQRRVWFSPPGKNIHMSILLRPQIEPARASGLTLVSAVAAARSLREATGLDIGIKWPNDLYIGNRKISGFLTEASTSAKGLEAVIVGLGLNVNTEAADVPEDLKTIMTSLKMEAGQTFDRLNLVLALRDAIVSACELFCNRGLEAFLPELRELDVTVGRRVAIQKDGATVLGTADAIGPQGQLIVLLDGGEQAEVLAGEVRFI